MAENKPVSGPPPADQLEAAALELARRGEQRLLVAMTERWAQVGTPSPATRLAEIAALLDLCAMERAAARLDALPDDGVDPLQRAKLTARMYVQRGWPNRAHDALDRARALAPTDPDVIALDRAVREPPLAPPMQVPGADVPFQARLRVAETLLCVGGFLKARKLLDALDMEQPDHPRVSDLLWALQGDFELAGTTLHQIAAHYGAQLPPMPLDELSDEGDPTSVTDVTMGDRAFADMVAGHGVAPQDTEDESETTMATRLEDLRAATTAPDLDDDDTAVLRVVGEATADLPVARQPAPTGELEEEDAAVVELRKRDQKAPPPAVRRPLPLPTPAPRKPARPRPPTPEPVAELDVAELDVAELDADAIDAEPADAGGRSGDEFPYAYVIATAVVLGITGLFALAAGAVVLMGR